ncbi:hypothetical protein RHMOL_Rhmol05G0169500 [Rhododendron molle]|uniref:Uncharacterized protein n=1 Tax=Rhododendron molle TaxID=49168 RepID=A0ACC0NPS8_RHOML|nr:hypothetical protein RHMOL_Rhmol05G0169500 [Rhododendron molle]
MLLLCYFDMEKGQCGNLPLPKFTLPSHLVENRFHLEVVDNCLYIRDCQPSPFPVPVNIWAMKKDYGDVGSWTLEWIIQQPSFWARLGPQTNKDFGRWDSVDDCRTETLASYNPVATAIQRISYHGVKFWKDSFTDVASFLLLKPGFVYHWKFATHQKETILENLRDQF